MFQEEYRRAYDGIKPRKLDPEQIINNAKLQCDWKVSYLLKPIVAPILSVCLFLGLTIPVLAEQIPAVYRVIQKYAPALAEYALPEELSSTSKDIVLQVDAVKVEGNTAEIILSFSDTKESKIDQISGKVDMYDSYRISNYGEKWQSGGCSFLEYDPLEDKAYFKVSISSERDFQQNKVRFSVNQLLTRCEKEEKRISLDEMIENPKQKRVDYSGGSVASETRSKIPFYVTDADSTVNTVWVMNEIERSKSMAEELAVTGVSYDEGVLRVQQCRGNFVNADRHIWLYLKDSEGTERIPEASVTWQEEIGGERVLFDETWFVITEEELEQYELFGMFYVTDGSVKGNWEVIFNIEK